jgi:hypothetical protein
MHGDYIDNNQNDPIRKTPDIAYIYITDEAKWSGNFTVPEGRYGESKRIYVVAGGDD